MDANSLNAEIKRLRLHAEKIARIRKEMVEELREIEREYSDRANVLVEHCLKLEEKK